MSTILNSNNIKDFELNTITNNNKSNKVDSVLKDATLPTDNDYSFTKLKPVKLNEEDFIILNRIKTERQKKKQLSLISEISNFNEDNNNNNNKNSNNKYKVKSQTNASEVKSKNKSRKKKKLTFKENHVEIVEIESYKKYTKEMYYSGMEDYSPEQTKKSCCYFLINNCSIF